MLRPANLVREGRPSNLRAGAQRCRRSGGSEVEATVGDLNGISYGCEKTASADHRRNCVVSEKTNQQEKTDEPPENISTSKKTRATLDMLRETNPSEPGAESRRSDAITELIGNSDLEELKSDKPHMNTAKSREPGLSDR